MKDKFDVCFVYNGKPKSCAWLQGNALEVLQLNRPVKPRCRHSGKGKNRDSWHLPVILLLHLMAGVFPLPLCLALPPGALDCLRISGELHFRVKGALVMILRNNLHFSIAHILNHGPLAGGWRGWRVTLLIQRRESKKGATWGYRVVLQISGYRRAILHSPHFLGTLSLTVSRIKHFSM